MSPESKIFERRSSKMAMETENMAVMLSGILPDELMVEILKRVPAGPLMSVFKSVCKSWRSLIQNPKFIVQHMETRASVNSSKYGGNIFLTRLVSDYGEVNKKNKKNKDSPLSYFYGVNSPVKFRDMWTPIPLKVGTSDQNVRICATGDGILYIQTCYAGDCLWNPVTGDDEIRFVPNLRHKVPQCGILGKTFFGVCFNTTATDAKVVKVWNIEYYSSDPEGESVFEGGISYAAVLNSSNCLWRKIDKTVPALLGPKLYDNLYIAGKCYWSACMNSPASIVSFDMVNEVFEKISLPEILSQDVEEDARGHLWKLAELKQSVAIITLPQYDDFAIHIWTLNMESWSKYLTVRRITLTVQGIELHEFIFPMGFCKDDEMVFCNSKGFLFFYNVRTGICTHTGIRVYASREEPFYVYNESLVCVKEHGRSRKRKFLEGSRIQLFKRIHV